MADQSSKPLQFFVRLLDGKSITLNFSSPLAYGEQIKQRIFEQTKIPTHLQRLICGGYQISDESVVSQSDSTVNLVLSLRGGMASSNGTNKYPLRMYEEGKAPLQWKSTNHNCNLANFGMVKNGLGLDVWDYLKNSAVGVIIKLYERNMIWCSATVHYFLTRQLSITRSHEIWTLISGRPIRLSLHEFSEITGLNCDPSNIEDKCDVNHKDFWKYMEVPIGAGPSLDELVLVLKRCQTWSFEQKRMVGWLFILSIGIFGISRSSRLPLRYAKMVLNPELFEKYPWGRVAFNSLVESIKIICFEAKKAYTVRGCVHALQVWAYESVPVLGELYGRRLEGMEVPLLSWGGSRDRVNLDDMLAEEKSIHDKVRVRHLIVKPEEEIYRPWSIEDETDTELDNMIRDILHDHLDESFWDSVGAKANKQKQKRRLHEVQMSRKKRKNDVNVSCAPTETFKDARENSGNRERELSFHGLDGLVQKVELMTEKIAEMVSNIANKAATCLEAAIDARLDERFVPMVNKLAMLEKDMEQLKQRTQACQPKEVSNSNEDDEAVSKTPKAGKKKAIEKKVVKTEIQVPIPILQETCSLQKERIKMLEQELASANNHIYFGFILDASMSRTRTEFEQQKQCMHGLEGRLADAELQLREGELLRKKLHNTILELKGNICVFCRVRPLLPDDGDGGHQVASVIAYPTSTESRGRGIDVVESGKKHQFTFDKVFDHRASQEEVFVEISELVQSAMDGYKVCIFAYGQTGSGKTYTMMGRPEAPEQKGLIPRSMEQIFKTSESLSTKGWKCNMRVSMLEVYNESIRDLLGIESVRTDFRSPGKQYTIRHNDNGNTVVNDLTIVDVCTIEQISSLLQKAAKSRSVGKTHMNEQSSRSHFVLTLQIFGVKSTEEQFQGVLNLIDLAGSQRLLKSGVAAETLKETVAINQSLSALGDVINALAKKKDHVPFRNSTLTYLLQPCLGGDSKTLMFVNISSDPSSTGESLCSLRFAAKVNECEI